MKLFSSLFKLFKPREEKQTSNVTTSKIAELAKAIYSFLNGTNFLVNASEGYLGNSTVFRCIQMIAKSAAAIPWLLYKQAGEQIDEVYEHPLKTLVKRPNPGMSFPQFLEALIVYFYLSGNAYVFAVGPENKPPRELHLLRPDAVRVTTNENGDPVYEYVHARGTRRIPSDRLLHLRFFSPIDDTRGASPISPIALFVDHKNAGVRWNLSLLLNGAKPGGALIHPRQLTEEQRKALKAVIDEYSGPGNAGRVLLLTGEFDFKEMGMNSQDLDWLAGLKLDTREIALTLGVPPQLVGDSENLTYSNYQEARRSFYQETIIPLVRFIVEEFNIWLVHNQFKEEDLFFDLDLDQVEALRENRKELWDLALSGVKQGVITINEARELLGYEKFESDDADMLYIPLSVVPIAPDRGAKFLSRTKANKIQSFYLPEDRIQRKWEEINNRVWTKYEKKWKEELEKVFKEQEDEVLKSLGAKQVTFDKAQWDKRLAQIALPLLEAAAREGFEDAKGELGVDVDYEQHRGLVYAWVEKEAGTKIKGINDTTLEQVRMAVKEGIENGEAISDIAKRIREVFAHASKHRSATIARTETLRAYRHGNLKLYGVAGITQGQWWTAMDERLCEECAALHGQVFDLGKAHELNESIHPNCRCVILPVLEG